MKQKWSSSCTECDICQKSLSPDSVDYFVDGRTLTGKWALMCPSCTESMGVVIGYGSGQKYDSRTKELIAGGALEFADEEI